MQPFTNILIKALAIYLITNAISSMGSMVIFQNQMGDQTPIPWLAVTGYLIVPIIIGLVVWFSSNKISERIHGQSLHVTDLELVSAGTFLIGLYLFSNNLGFSFGEYSQLSQIPWHRICTLAISILLLISPKMLTRIYKKVKYFD